MKEANTTKSLQRAAAQGDEAALRRLLDAGAPVDTALHDETSVDRSNYERSRTPLLVAAAGKHEAAALLLVARGADVNARDTFSGATPLVEAAKAGLTALVAALLQGGAHADGRDNYDDLSALAAAARGGHAEILRRLLAAGAPPDPRALNLACHYGHQAVVDLLFAAGYGPRMPWKGQSPLRAAAGGGQAGLVAQLLERGAHDAAALSDALFAAANAGHTDVVRLLCARGAHVDGRDGHAWTALMIAAWQGHLDTTAALLEAGADRGLADGKGKTAADWAKQGKHLDVARLLDGSSA